MAWRWVLLVAGWLWLTGLTHAGSQQPLILSSAYWQDTTAQVQLDEAQRQNYTAYPGIFNRGYGPSAHWLRLTLAASQKPVALRLTPPWVDEITLYDPAAPEQAFRAGDNHPQGSTAAPSLGYTFVLPASPQPRDLWLRIKSTSTHRLAVDALPADELPAAETRTLAWAALYTAIVLLMLLALLSVWWVQPEKVLGTYLLRHSIYIAYSLGYLGLPNLFLPAGTLPAGVMDTTFSLLVTLTLPVGLWFDRTLLSSYGPRQPLMRALKLMAWVSLALPLMVLAGQHGIATFMTVQGLMLASLLVFITALTCHPDPLVDRLMPKKVMLGYYSLILGSLVIGLVSVLGWLQPLGWSQYLLILHGLASGMVMTVILFVRGQRQHRHHQQMAWQLQKAQQDTELEQRRRQEQSQFLHMLMHELKTPLAVVSLALGTRNHREENLQHAGRAVQDMKAIIDRCVQADQVGDLSLSPHRQSLQVPQLLQQLAKNHAALGTRMQLTAPPNLPAVQTDAQLLQIILNNLLDNAMRYGDAHTPIHIACTPTPQDGQPGLSVRIANPPGLAGWPEATQIFSKYYRSSGAQRESGSGLGLYLSQQLAHTLGGSLNYEPSATQVEFVLWLPLNPV